MEGGFHRQRLRLLFAVLAVVSLFVLLTTSLVFLQQQARMAADHERRTALEVELIGGFLADALLRHDYSEALQFLDNWRQNHAYVTALKAMLDNGRVFFDYNQASPDDAKFEVMKAFDYGDRQVTLAMCHDSADMQAALGQLARNLGLVAAGLIGLMGGALWWVLFRWSVKPMEQEITRRTESLRQAMQYSHQLLHSMGGHIAILDVQGRIIQTNRAWQQFARANGYAGRADMIGLSYFQTAPDLEAVARDGDPLEQGVLAVLRGQRESFEQDYACHHSEGQFWFVLRVAPVEYHGERRVIVRHDDITQIKRAQQALADSEAELRLINQVYKALSDANKAVSMAVDEQALLDQVAEIISLSARFSLVWIGYARDDANRTVEVMTACGPQAVYVEGLQVSWGAGPWGNGPIGSAIRTGQSAIVRDIRRDAGFGPWRQRALDHGLRYCAAFPMRHGETTLGAIGAYSSLLDPFAKEEIALLDELAQNLAFGVLAIRERLARAEAQRELERLAVTDSLTQLANRRKTEQLIDAEIRRAARYDMPFSVILLDIDHFKRINDTFGHPAGDQVLIQLAQTLRENLRQSDAAGRWGGEEFLIVCPFAEADGARQLAEKIRRSIAATDLPKVQPVTASLGLTQYRRGDDAKALLARADQALYAAKGQGRNRVEAG